MIRKKNLKCINLSITTSINEMDGGNTRQNALSITKLCKSWSAFKEVPQSFSQVSAEGRWTSSWHHPAPPEQVERGVRPPHLDPSAPPTSEPDTAPIKHPQEPETQEGERKTLSKQMYCTTQCEKKNKRGRENNDYSVCLLRQMVSWP